MDSRMDNPIILILAVVFIIWLLSKRWTWVIALGIGFLASVLSAFASVIHFQILGAMGFILLATIIWLIFCAMTVVFDRLEE